MATTTLTNGTKIPERASRDWYSDLSTNWYLLDNHLGDTGSHLNNGLAPKATADADGNTITSTYATKTELSTLSNTVDTKANDADVVHKADAETITGAKTFSDTLTSANVVPSATDTYSLGSASVQYNAIYGKSYYYNGTQWGLDVANTWTGSNTYSKTITVERNTDTGNFLALRNSVAELGSTPASATPVTIAYPDKNDNNLGYMGMFYDTDGSNRFRLYVRNKYTSGAPSTSGTVDYITFQLKLNADRSKEGILRASFRPYDTNTYDLGTSTNKWKSLNGVNPGALSLPGEYTSSVTEYITNKTGGNNAYTAPADGWVGIQASSATLDSTNFVFMGRTSDGTTHYAQNVSSPINGYWNNLYHGCILLPVISGKTYGIRCICDSVDAKFYKANGNV